MRHWMCHDRTFYVEFDSILLENASPVYPLI
jgi:hypothetical protein